jgi:hypothetical protein
MVTATMPFAVHGPSTTAGLSVTLTAFALAISLEAIRRRDWWRAWWIDAAVATTTFAAAIDIYDRQERKMGCAARRFEGRMALAGLVYWIFVALWCCLIPPPLGIPDGVPGSVCDVLHLLAEIASGVLAYDLLFYFVHWSMHATGAPSHSLHHTHAAEGQAEGLRARDVLSHSLLDGGLQVLTNILVQRTTPWGATKSRTARWVHNVVVTWMLTESHTCAPTPRVARRFFSGVRRHRAHHHGEPFFQQFFGFLDDLRLNRCHADGQPRPLKPQVPRAGG